MERATNGSDLLSDSASLLTTIAVQIEHEPVLLNRRPRHGPLQASRDLAPQASSVSNMHLTQNKYILDCPVAPQLLSRVASSGVRPQETSARDEFSHCRYTAVTCDANDFIKSNYNLRPLMFGAPRGTEILIAITIYNEDDVLLGRTLQGVLRSIKYVLDLESHSAWHKESWRKIIVCIIGDGTSKFDPRALSLLAGLGLYQDGVCVRSVNGEQTQAHVFEYTTRAEIDVDEKTGTVGISPGTPNAIPCQMILFLKQKSQKKVNSHRWVFSALCGVLQPNVCILVEGGTTVSPASLYQLWRTIDTSPKVGCAIPRSNVFVSRTQKWFSPLIGFERFESHLANVFERPFEALTKHRSGINREALFAYRYKALLQVDEEPGPLGDYYAIESGKKIVNASSIFESNRYLVEERVLAWALLTSANSSWNTVLVDSAEVFSDAPEDIGEFLAQRRRWINGGYWSSFQELRALHRIQWKKIGFWDSSLLAFSFIYQVFEFFIRWFTLGNYLAVSVLFVRSLGHHDIGGRKGEVFSVAFCFCYVILLFSSFLTSLGNKPPGARSSYIIIMYSWTLLSWSSLIAAIYTVCTYARIVRYETSPHKLLQGELFTMVVWPSISLPILWIIGSITASTYEGFSVLGYLVILPGYTNLAWIYSFCNLHDVSWSTINQKVGDYMLEGNAPAVVTNAEGMATIPTPVSNYDAHLKTLQEPAVYSLISRRSIEDKLKSSRTRTVLLWVTSNALLVTTVFCVPALSDFQVTAQGAKGFVYVGVVLWTNVGFLAVQYFGALLYMFKTHLLRRSR